MYRTCLFCHADLGANDLIEHLPIGRRLAVDSGKGRLWVVCRKCERWNLTPFGDRWEAMEECERLFRDTRVRFSTDEIGIARLKDGTEVVRIGEPLRPEFAAWRYGDQFGRRRRRHYALAVGSAVLVGALVVAPAVAGIGFIGVRGLYELASGLLKDRRTVARIGGAGEQVLPLTQMQIEAARILSVRGEEGWRLSIPKDRGEGFWRSFRGEPPESHVFEGNRAREALIKLMPRLNQSGGGKKEVQEAVQLLELAPTFEALIPKLAYSGELQVMFRKQDMKTIPLPDLELEYRLALEMSAHEDAERRWLAGELLELERAWREAEELAAIADKLGLPAEVEERVASIRSSEGR
ncbi:MAG: hypothetical protein HOP28_16630 [Gemmatimonadales bacterium]|nr:hypothetical protein [Gemmatimonadales bacterium]